ncbi:MAG: TetR/AcrR family transcriptional regulator [Pseudomonadota bacterium]
MSEELSPGDAGAAAPIGNIKATREDWLALAKEVLVRDGIEGVKIKPLGETLNVSRSSFYWYFNSRQDLLDALLEHWQATNTKSLVEMAGRPARTITEAVGNVFRCVINPALFDPRLDFAIRDWARRSEAVHRVLRASEEERLTALEQMFARFDYPALEVITRARILYYMQIGYDDAQLNEPMETRNRLMPAYLVGFTGQTPTKDEIAALRDYANNLNA